MKSPPSRPISPKNSVAPVKSPPSRPISTPPDPPGSSTPSWSMGLLRYNHVINRAKKHDIWPKNDARTICFHENDVFFWNSRPVTWKMTLVLCVFRSLLLKNTKKHDICRFSSSQKSKLTTPLLKNGFSNVRIGAYFPLIQKEIVFFCPSGNRGCFQACFSSTPKHQWHFFIEVDFGFGSYKKRCF